MLISPPFLPDRSADQAEDPWLDAALIGTGDGMFPISHRLGWHGGRHLAAPLDAAGGRLPVRAVADGKVLFVRQRTATDDRAHPLWYDRGYTSDAVVVIEHRTEIGADAQDRPVPLCFHSVYLHLHDVEKPVRVGQPVRRKDLIGSAGHIAGEPGRIHFEICLDGDNLARLAGRTAGDLPLARDGRDDVLYGAAYFRLPAGTPVYAAQPPLGASAAPPPARILARNGEDWFVGLRYDRGDATLATCRASGEAVAAPHREADHGEYRLFARAQALSAAVRQANADAGRPADPVPSPSACQELLRWGRVLGHEALTPPSTPHWRQINTPAGLGWVDLNAPGITRYSDADFPHWCGWSLVDDSADRDSRCDSQAIRRMLDADGDGRVMLDELQARLRLDAVRRKLDRTICRFPSEWDAATIDARWGWLRQPSPECPRPLDAADRAAFEAYAQALCFDCPALFQAPWRVGPQAFIRHMRQCGWRSAREIAQMVPSHAVRAVAGGVKWEAEPPVQIGPDSLLGRHCIPLSKAFRRYGIGTPLRQVAFLGNSFQETGWLRTLLESGGPTLSYAPWHGRGFLQLTHPGNYFNYWLWRGRAVSKTPDKTLTNIIRKISDIYAKRFDEGLKNEPPFDSTVRLHEWMEDVGGGDPLRNPTREEQYAPSDSASYYWLKTNMARYADEPHMLERCSVPTDRGLKVYYRSAAFWRASATVNLPGAISNSHYQGINGFDSRCSAYGILLTMLSEMRFPDVHGNSMHWQPEGYARRFLP